MSATLKRFETAASEEDCLDEVMRLRHGEAPCKACDERAGFDRLSRNRAYACRSCGFQVYPCQGTPFARSSLPLRTWFVAIAEMAEGAKAGARGYRKAFGLGPRDADELAAGIEAMRAAAKSPGNRLDLSGPIAAFTQARLDAGSASSAEAAAEAPRAERAETAWQTLRAGIALPDFEKRPMLGVAAIAVLALLGGGIGWLLVPSPPQMDEEIEQATAILTLGNDKPVIVVSNEVAEQLYDVSDADTQDESPLAASIEIAPSGTGGTARKLGDAQGRVRLALGLGRDLLKGDLGAAKAKVAARPELAAYGTLLSVLEGKGPRNPDELLAFGPVKIRRHLVEKIVKAARETDMDPVLLMAIADKESSFQTEVQAATSSAQGLYQFIEKTWLGVVREFGPRYGLAKEAQLVAGDLPAAERSRILDLRRDAYLSAAMAGEMLKRDSNRIARRIARPLTGGEIYLVHFLGPDGAERLLDQASKKPDALAGDLLPRAAAANKTIFFGANAEGESKSLSVTEVRSKIETMISVRLDRYRGVSGPGDAGKGAAKPAR